MRKIDFDVDIDFASREEILSKIPHINASIEEDSSRPHGSGVYFQRIPVNPFTNLASIDYKVAQELGFIKIDFLNLWVYKNFESREQLERMVEREPIWELLEHDEIIKQLIHIKDHAGLVKMYKPRSIDELAIVLALIRPSKRSLIGRSFKDLQEIIWKKPTDGSYYFKRSHGIAYALAIVSQLNLIVESIDLSN